MSLSDVSRVDCIPLPLPLQYKGELSPLYSCMRAHTIQTVTRRREDPLVRERQIVGQEIGRRMEEGGKGGGVFMAGEQNERKRPKRRQWVFEDRKGLTLWRLCCVPGVRFGAAWY